ncbi:hypothetical protein EV193_104181 [Herbihabitans rhizosphaerae]|uniref:Uncharacterized protein n=1 Tax=Herbihabitans rhizosphaerae TaxID=1872711 RepID=A0A4Q7KS87_9PSEU|nr:SseB family protein [Herbihabitans rhizosphaerae]RZS38970.1 hypothetical protein EV193_104181 [Herbihabitans rhizosphaerae]
MTAQQPDNQALIDALRRAYTEQRPPGEDFAAALVGATLFVPLTPEGGPVGFGDPPALHAFPDQESMIAFYAANTTAGEVPRAALVPARDLCAMSLQHHYDVAVTIPETAYRLGRGETQAVAEGVVRVDSGAVVTTDNTPIRIGRPAQDPSAECLADLRAAIADMPARVVWFWMRLGDGPAHLGLAVRPDTAELRQRVGHAIQPVWERHSPDNAVITVLPVRPPYDAHIAESGEPLEPSA